MESHYSDNCPFCNKINFWSNGDESNLTDCDVEAVKCWNCNKIWSLDDMSLVKDEDLVFYADGKKELK